MFTCLMQMLLILRLRLTAMLLILILRLTEMEVIEEMEVTREMVRLVVLLMVVLIKQLNLI